MIAHAVINIEAQREQRRRVGMANLFARQLSDVYAMMYAKYPIRTGNGLLKDGKEVPPPDREWFKKRQADLLERLTKEGLL